MPIMPSDKDLQQIFEVLSIQFNENDEGEDIAQYALLRLCEAILGRGETIQNPFAFCYNAAAQKQIDDWRHREVITGGRSGAKQYYSEWIATSDCGDVADTYLAREVLASCPEELIMDTPLSAGGGEEEEALTPKDWTRRSRAKAAIRDLYGL